MWLIAYRMSEKWVTRVGALIFVSDSQKNKRIHAVHSVHGGRDSLSADDGGGSIGGLV